VQVPAAQVVGPVHPLPPHCPYKGAPVPAAVLVAGFVLMLVVFVLVTRVVVGLAVEVDEAALDVVVGELPAPQVRGRWKGSE
jgi:hypothetical protein